MSQRQRIHLPMQETQVRSLGWEDPLEEEMATHSSVLARKIPWPAEPGGLQSMGRKESDTAERLTHTHSFYDALSKKLILNSLHLSKLRIWQWWFLPQKSVFLYWQVSFQLKMKFQLMVWFSTKQIKKFIYFFLSQWFQSLSFLYLRNGLDLYSEQYIYICWVCFCFRNMRHVTCTLKCKHSKA